MKEKLEIAFRYLRALIEWEYRFKTGDSSFFQHEALSVLTRLQSELDSPGIYKRYFSSLEEETENYWNEIGFF